ncbi:MAG: hypothetical protein ABL970_18475 [Nitrospira sp.]
MACYRVVTVALSLSALIGSGCAQRPLPLMESYLGGSEGPGGRDVAAVQPERAAGPFNVGLVLINDTKAQGSAPALSEKGKAFLADRVRERVQSMTAIHVQAVLPSGIGAQPQGQDALAKMARESGQPYLLVALFSSAESEVPTYLPLTGDPEQGGSRPAIPGYEAVNYALAELALIDAATGRVVARSDGRAWTRLNRLNVPMQSNAYPVIHRSLRPAPIYPPEADAKDIMRSMAGDEALEQAVVRLQEAWPKS